MKRIALVFFLATCSVSLNVGCSKTKHVAKKGAHETAELASKGKSEVTDKTSDKYVGPNGQKIYVDDGNSYYYVNERGKKKYVKQSKLRPK